MTQAQGGARTIDVSLGSRMFRRLWWCARTHYFAATVLMLPLPLLMVGYLWGGGVAGAFAQNPERDHVLEVTFLYLRYLAVIVMVTSVIPGHYAKSSRIYAAVVFGFAVATGLAFIYAIVSMRTLFGQSEDYTYWYFAIGFQLILVCVAIVGLHSIWTLHQRHLPQPAAAEPDLDASRLQYPSTNSVLQTLFLPGLAALLAWNLDDVITGSALNQSFPSDLSGWLRRAIDVFLISPGNIILNQLSSMISVFNDYAGLWEFVIPILLFLAEIAFVVAAWRFAERMLISNAQKKMLRDGRPPVLLLRSFGDDDAAILSKSFVMRLLRRRTRLEEVLAAQVERLGPFVAVGMPGERLPRLGAYRAYLGDDAWQPFVLRQITGARLILLVVGTSPWVKWELEQVLRNGAAGKLALVFPPSSAAVSAQRWNVVVECLSTSPWGKSIPAGAPEGIRALRLRPDGDVTFVTSNRSGQRDFDLALQAAI